MYIPSPNGPACDPSIQRQLEVFINQPEPEEVAPCPGCNQHIPVHCSPTCDRAAQALSIEPEKYPIEDKVVPLVFEIMATRLIQTCWSCEGHLDYESRLWKLPQVCFHTESQVYPKLMLIHLSRLYQAHMLTNAWHIVLTDMANTMGITYSIQPDLNRAEDIHLGALQLDLMTIAGNLHSALKQIARELLGDYCRQTGARQSQANLSQV